MSKKSKIEFLNKEIKNSNFYCRTALRELINAHDSIKYFIGYEKDLEASLRKKGKKLLLLPGSSVNLNRSFEEYLGVLGKYFLEEADEFADIEAEAAKEYFELTGKNPYLTS